MRWITAQAAARLPARAECAPADAAEPNATAAKAAALPCKDTPPFCLRPGTPSVTPDPACAVRHCAADAQKAHRRRSIEAGTRTMQARMTPDTTAEGLHEALALGAETVPRTRSNSNLLSHHPKTPGLPHPRLPGLARALRRSPRPGDPGPTRPGRHPGSPGARGSSRRTLSHPGTGRLARPCGHNPRNPRPGL